MTDYPKMTANDVLDLVQLFDRHQNDYRDVKALCQHFEIEMPLEYVEFETIEHITPDNVV